MKVQPFSPVARLDGVYVARAGKLNCIAFRLRDASMCLYSPVAGLEVAAFDSLAELGDVSVLLAPNHYHNKGLKGHTESFPNASLICSKQAEPRLNKVTGLAFDQIETLGPLLGGNQKILIPEGLKTGEVWIEVQTGSEIAWIVTDAFTAKLHAPGDWAETPTMLGTFPRYGVKDALAFKDWLNTQFSHSRPSLLLSCHGSPVKATDLGAKLAKLLADTL